MKEKLVWYFKKENRKQGPLSRDELTSLVKRGEIDGSTPICTEDAADWIPLAESEHFNLSTLDETPTVPLSRKRAGYMRETDEAHIHARPWVRFWARMIDYSLLYAAFLLISEAFRFLFFPLPPLMTLILLFVWVFIEAALLSSWGKTPGKWLLKITVLDVFQHRPSFSLALNRSFSVWWLGMGAGLPIISLITMIIAAVRLSHTGSTSWDKRSEFHILHGHVGVLRTLIAFFYFLCFFYFFSWSFSWIR